MSSPGSGGLSRNRLLELLRERSFAKRRVVLASGKESDFFIDCKQTVLTAEGHSLVADVMLDELTRMPAFDAVAGVELGGCPLASAVSLVSFQRKTPHDCVYVRKDAKDHGSARQIEGNTTLAKGARVLLLEDVVTSGGSTMNAAAKIELAGYTIAGVIALVDRLEGGRDAIGAKYTFHAIYTRHDFMGPS